jgi:dihydropteroate synthase
MVDARRGRRVLPVIHRLRAATDAPLSVDTYKASVARAALDAGADLVNDVGGLQMDPDLAPLVAERGAPVVIMHNRSKPRDAAQQERLGGHYVGVHYDDLIADILRELGAQAAHAEAAGIPRERIIIDPGIGFGKTVEQNLSLLNHADAFRAWGCLFCWGVAQVVNWLNARPAARGAVEGLPRGRGGDCARRGRQRARSDVAPWPLRAHGGRDLTGGLKMALAYIC